LPVVLPHWDVNSNLSLLRRISIDVRLLAARCGLNRSDKVRACAVWRSSGTALRGAGSFSELALSEQRQVAILRAEIPGYLLAGDLQVHTLIVLGEARSGGRPLAARRAGSILWDDRVVVALEGSASRFPVEVLDFNAVNWAPYQAGWFLSWNKDDLEMPFLRNVRLYLNSSRPAIIAAVRSSNPSGEQKAIRSAIYYDVGRQMIRGALQSEELVESPESFPEGSTGDALLRLFRVLFGSDMPSAWRSTMRERPEHFDSLLQGSLKVFEDV
jgi:hypothetical protein